MVGLHDLFSADRAPTLRRGKASGSVSQSGDVETPRVKTQLPKSGRHPPWAEALETGSRTYRRPVLPKFKLRLMLTAHICRYCCTKVSHRRSEVRPKSHIVKPSNFAAASNNRTCAAFLPERVAVLTFDAYASARSPAMSVVDALLLGAPGGAGGRAGTGQTDRWAH